MSELSTLQPVNVWKHFEEICKVPRPSKKEEKIIAFLEDFAHKHNLTIKKDDTGNILIKKNASKGFENRKTVVLQSHVDMVCEKNSDYQHDFNTDPIQPYIDGEWVKAKGTTLGSDNGFGIAAQMEILAGNYEHGPIECLFTVDEETGLTGAFHLQPGFFDGKILINLDSEDEGELFIGCAGGVDTLATLPCKRKKTTGGGMAYMISVSGLKGGHSGDDIEKFRENAIKVLNRIIWTLWQKTKIRVNSFEGGNLRNAIPREARAIIVVKEKNTKQMLDEFHRLETEFTRLKREQEPNIKILIEPVALPTSVFTNKTTNRLLNSIYACPHGIISMSMNMPGLVETSTNLASVKAIDPTKMLITTSQRSSLEASKEDIANQVRSVFSLAGANAEHTDGYPGWTPNTDSGIMRITEQAYLQLFNTKPEIKAIHAGLECGLFLEKYPYLDMISFGPTIYNAHSPDEMIHIGSSQKFWELLLEVLRKIPVEK